MYCVIAASIGCLKFETIINSDSMNTWPLDFPIPQMQNRLEIGRKIVSRDHTLQVRPRRGIFDFLKVEWTENRIGRCHLLIM
jgi:hypothetical protein